MVDGKSGKESDMPHGIARPLISRGDIDGFIGLALDNMIQFLLIYSLCKGVLGFGDALVLERVLPGAALSIIIGNLFYAWQARQLARQTGRSDVTALPYGINTPSVFAYVFFVMLPARQQALAAVADGTATADPALVAWQVGLAAGLVSGLIETAGAFVAQRIRQATPRAALLSTLAGIAISFISIDFALKTFKLPLITLLPLAVVCATYFARLRMPLGLPGGLWAVLLGATSAWICCGIGLPSPVAVERIAPAYASLGWYWPCWVFDDVMAGLRHPITAATLVGVMIPMGVFNVLGSLQNIESADAAGDDYPTRPSLLVNGLGTIGGTFFGSCFPTTIYIGHPGWKAMGAGSAYSTLNALLFAVIALFGLSNLIQSFIPLEAGMAIVLYIGIVMTAQAFQATPREHAPAVAIGLFPGIAAWGALVFQLALFGACIAFAEQLAQPPHLSFSQLIDRGAYAGIFEIDGLIALAAGFLLTSMIWSALTTRLIEQRPRQAACWALIGAGCAGIGFIHSGTLTSSGISQHIADGSGWPWAVGYLLVAAFLLLIPSRNSTCVPTPRTE
jgi:AGZA family xanthine/uracil permease-like MFS transporter